MKFAISFFFTVVFGLSLNAQEVEWYDLIVISKFRSTNYLLMEIDSIYPKCKQGRKKEYCTTAERIHDSKVVDLRESQKNTLKQLNSNYQLVSQSSIHDATYADFRKYPFLIDYDLLSIEKNKATNVYLKLDFLLIERETKRVIARSNHTHLYDPFESLDYLIDELEKFKLSE
ncbi:MAG: hypothetical protein ACPGD5_01035 [Salibacteraceae bacterium]